MTSLPVLRLIAVSDPGLFEHHLRQAGLTIVGRKDYDSLRRVTQDESVLSIATLLGEGVDDHLELTPLQKQLRDIADQAGYLVGLSEGLDQQPGAWPNPIRIALNASPEDEEPEAPAGGDQAAPGTPTPPDGGAPPPPGGAAPPPA